MSTITASANVRGAPVTRRPIDASTSAIGMRTAPSAIATSIEATKQRGKRGERDSRAESSLAPGRLAGPELMPRLDLDWQERPSRAYRCTLSGWSAAAICWMPKTMRGPGRVT